MNWTKWIRQGHRWLSVAFTVAVIANGVVVAQGKYRAWLGFLALLPMALLLLSGLYLFALPYAAKWRNRRGIRLNGRPAVAGVGVRADAGPMVREIIHTAAPEIVEAK